MDDSKLPMSTQAKGKRKREALGKGGIEGLDVGYSELKDHVEKSVFFLADAESLECAVCAMDLGPKIAMALVCPQEECRVASHMTCLATKFIEDEGGSAAVTPISGRCPGCNVELQWIDLIKELSLRARGEKEVARITKKPKEHRTKIPKARNAVASPLGAHTFQGDDVAESEEKCVVTDVRASDASDDSLPDDWHYQDDDDDDIMSVTSGHSALSADVEAAKRCPSKLPAVIEDSELDEAEFST